MCYYISANTLKWLIYISCVLVLGIGSVLVWVGFLVQSSAFIQVLEYSYSGFIVIACGGILIFVAFIGIIGAWKQRNFFLTTFIISSIIIGILLVSFGSVLIYVRKVSDEYLASESSCLEHFEKADYTSALAEEVFCKLYCPCDLDQTTAESLGYSSSVFYRGSAVSTLECNPCESIQTYDTDVQLELQEWVKERLGYDINATDCAVTTDEYKDAYYTDTYTEYISLITWIEESFECSGLCTYRKLLFFSDVTEAFPTTPCYESLNEWAQKNLLTYGILSIVLGTYQIAILYFAFSLCCCPKRKIDLPEDAFNSPNKAFKG